MALLRTLLIPAPAIWSYHVVTRLSDAVSYATSTRDDEWALTLEQGKFFEVRYFLNIIVSGSHT